MDIIQREILRILYQNKDTILREMGWLGQRIFDLLKNCIYSQHEFLTAFNLLISHKCVEKYETYLSKNPSLRPTGLLRARVLYNPNAPEAPLHYYYVITEIGIQEYMESLQKKVFIIHGHSEAKWRELKSILTERFSLLPIILSEQANQGSTIIEKFEFYANKCAYAFAIFTPDDIVDNNGKKYFQARPNVIFELGWFTAHLGRNKVCILYQDKENNSIFSDFDGIVQCRFYQQIQERFLDIERELKQAGIIT